MSSGARLRSVNNAFGRSKTGTAFLISAAPPEQELYRCTYTAFLGGLGGPINEPAFPLLPVVDNACTCSTIPAPDFANRLLYHSLNYRAVMNGMGWEDPPHPSVILTGQTSGTVVTVPDHCAGQCLGVWPANEFNDYGMNPDATGCDHFLDQSSTIPGDLPVSSGIFHLFYSIAGGFPPWTASEPVDMQFIYKPATLPDPGPYNIVNARAHRTNASYTTLTLDRAVRYATGSALHIQGTGLYDGMQAGRKSFDDFQDAPEDLAIETPFIEAVTTGTMERIWDQPFDCWENDGNPPGPRPPLPPAP